jgi:hypothetical protein
MTRRIVSLRLSRVLHRKLQERCAVLYARSLDRWNSPGASR